MRAPPRSALEESMRSRACLESWLVMIYTSDALIT
jgi:hypothetical protein